MEIPKYDQMYNNFLEILKDKKEHDIKEIRKKVAKKLNLTEENLNEKLESGYSVFNNRIGWTGTYLKKAGVIKSTKRGVFVITKQGLNLLNECNNITNENLKIYDSFLEFINKSNKKIYSNVLEHDEYTPQEQIGDAIQKLNNELAEELLDEILKQDFNFFESLAVKLLTAMGYGKIENATVTPKTDDEGIDGIVLEDELGINTIYIQAKRYDKQNPVSRPELQKFVGAISGKNVKKGVFITTSYFGKPAINYAKGQNIVLIDGEKLVELMIKYNVGCYTDSVYSLKKLDLDFFENI